MSTTAPPDTDPVRPDHASLQAASEWFAAFDGGRPDGEGTSPSDRAEWQRWLAADARHPVAWACVEAVRADFSSLSARGGNAARDVISAPAYRPARRRVLGSLGVMAVVGMGGWLALRQARPGAQPVLAQARTARGEVRALALADGAQAWLNAGTSITLENTDVLRLVRLVQGEIFITSQHDGTPVRRPLAVQTPQGRVEALGTRFSVRTLAGGLTQVAVFDGAVRLLPRALAADAAGQGRILRSGQQASFGAGRVADAEPSQPAREAWVRGLLIAQNMRLDEFVQELSRYRSGDLDCDPAVAALRLDGVFPTRDTDEALRMLAQALPVRVTHVTAHSARIGPR